MVRIYTKMWIITVFSGFMELLDGFPVPPGCSHATDESRSNGDCTQFEQAATRLTGRGTLI